MYLNVELKISMFVLKIFTSSLVVIVAIPLMIFKSGLEVEVAASKIQDAY